MASLNTSHVEAFAAWLPRCRWFSAKNLGDIESQLRSIDCIDLPPRTDDGEKIQLACIRFETGIGETTFLAIVQFIPDHHAMLTCRDATTDAAFNEWLLELIQSGGTLQTTVGKFVGRSLQQQVGEVPLTNNLSTSPLGKDTSNTSTLITTQDANSTTNNYVSKLFHTYHMGIAPEVEVGLHLTQCGWSGAPPLVGWLEYIPTRKEQGGAVATVHKAITPSIDAWEYSIQTLLQGVNVNDALLDMARRIGTLTAGMHEALANAEDSAAFSPQAPSEKERCETTCSMTEHARSVWALLSTADVPLLFQQRVNNILAHQQPVLDALEGVACLQQTAAYIRVHGDYHLGQLLFDESDETLHVIDFEGEPQRTLAERRRKTSIFKDLAGMSRSFEYLCHRPENSKTRVKATDLTRAFLSAYTDKAHGQSFYPDTKGEAESLLNAFMLDKAIYELAYEAQHRPDWLDAPLTAVETFLRTGLWLTF